MNTRGDVQAPRHLIDERSTDSVRARIGALLTGAATADIAVARIRLGALDLRADEVGAVDRCRVLLGRLDVGMLLDTTDMARRDGRIAAAADRLSVLRAFARSGRLEIRAAGTDGWTPDFSVFRGAVETALLGAHYFGTRDYPIGGPSFTAITTDPPAISLLSARFVELWERGHDVLPAVRDVLEEAHALALGAPGPGGRRDRADTVR